jgi:hypothetical protein
MSESMKDDVIAGEVSMTPETLNQDDRRGSPITSNYSKSSESYESSVSETNESGPKIPIQNDIQMMLNNFNQKIEENDRSIKRIEENITALYGRLEKMYNGEKTTSSSKKMNKKEAKKQKKKMNKKEAKKQKKKKKKMNKKEAKKKGKGSKLSKGATKLEKMKGKKLRTKTKNKNDRKENKGKNK